MSDNAKFAFALPSARLRSVQEALALMLIWLSLLLALDPIIPALDQIISLIVTPP